MNPSRLPARAAIGVFVLLGGIVVMSIAWEGLLAGEVYQCSDSLGFPGFLMPGQWVHEPIACVSTVDPNPPMSGHDAIKTGWSVAKLWWAWWGMIAVVVMSSLAPVLACIVPGRPDEDNERQVRGRRRPEIGC